MPIKIDGTNSNILLRAGTSNTTTLTSALAATPWTFTLPPNPGVAGQVLTTDGLGNTSWTASGGGGGSPGGSNTQIQFNNSGSFGGSGGFTFDGSNIVSIGTPTVSDGTIRLFNTGTVNAISIRPPNNAQSYTLTLPSSAGVSGQVLTTDGSGNLSWSAGGGGGSPAAPSGSVQFNNSGSFGGSSNFTYSESLGADITLGSFGSRNGGVRLQNVLSATGNVRIGVNPASTTSWSLTLPAGPGTNGYVLQTDGAGLTSWVSASAANIPITNDTTTAANQFPLFSPASSGSLAAVSTASPDYTYNPASGTLTAPHVEASSAIFLNAQNITANYTIPAGMNGLSAGPINTGTFIVTVPAGRTWKVV